VEANQPNLVNQEQAAGRVVIESSRPAPRGLLAAEVEQELGGGGEEHVNPGEDGGVGEMRLVLDPRLAIVAADVAGDRGRAVEDPDGVFSGDECQGAPHESVQDRVVVAVEAEVRRLAVSTISFPATRGSEPRSLPGSQSSRIPVSPGPCGDWP
jgi:hypothetical protein